MKVNLRQAHAIQTQIREALGRLDLSTTTALNEFENAKEQIDTARDRFYGSLKTRDKLLGVLLDIRKKVAQANADEGISDLLADAAGLDQQIKDYADFANSREREKDTVLQGRIEKRLNANEESVYRPFGSSEIASGILEQEEIDRFQRELANLKRTKQSVQEMILAANIDTEIELDADEEKLLARMGVISDFDG